jgi:hypothetical protein
MGTTAREVIESWAALKRGLKYSVIGRPSSFMTPDGREITDVRVGDPVIIKDRGGKMIQARVREIYVPRFPKGILRELFEKIEGWSGTVAGLSSLCLIHMLHLSVPFGTIFVSSFAGGALINVLGELLREAGVDTDRPQDYYDRATSASWRDVMDYRVVLGIGGGSFVSGGDVSPSV